MRISLLALCLVILIKNVYGFGDEKFLREGGLNPYPAARMLASSGDVTLPDNKVSLGDKITFHYEIGDSDITAGIVFTQANTFFGVGFGTGMIGADMWIFQIDGSAVTAGDYMATEHAKPSSDVAQGGTNDVTVLGYNIEADKTTVKVKRALNTGDSKDKVIKAGSTSMVWAYAGTSMCSDSTKLCFHDSNKAVVSVELKNSIKLMASIGSILAFILIFI
jgi:hypothetical protein